MAQSTAINTTPIVTPIKTTLVLEFVTAPIIRCVARQDMPEYGLLEGQVFYLAHSASESKATGKNVYHIVRWDYWKIEFRCPCKATVTCYHQKAINADCSKAHTVQGYKPVAKTVASVRAERIAKPLAVREAEAIAEALDFFRNAETPSCQYCGRNHNSINCNL